MNDPTHDGHTPDTESAYVPSPCQNVCVMNEETGYCLGCWRTIEEIMDWGVMPAAVKRRVLEEIATREDYGKR